MPDAAPPGRAISTVEALAPFHVSVTVTWLGADTVEPESPVQEPATRPRTMAVDFTARSSMESCCIVTPESGAAPGIRHIATRRKRNTYHYNCTSLATNI